MIIPAAPDRLASMSDDEVVTAYEGLGFDHETALAYTAVLRGHAAKAAEPEATLMTVKSARELAESVGHDELLAEVAKSERAGIGFLMLSESDDGVVVGAPKTASVGLFLKNRLDTPGAEPDPHVVLASLGNASDLTLNQTRKLVATVGEVAARHGAISAAIRRAAGGSAEVVAPGLDSLRDDLVTSLKAAGLPVQDRGRSTVRLAKGASEHFEFEETFDTLTTGIGSFRYDAELSKAEESFEGEGLPIVKSVEEKRFTLAPMYIPNQYDSQGDWAEPEDLQQALWKFQRGNKLIALQHQPEAGPQGEAVEMMVVPWEHTVTLHKADGTSRDVTFPAGTPWLGVIWSEEVWPLVKAGKVRGYSIGGRASLLNVDLPEAL